MPSLLTFILIHKLSLRKQIIVAQHVDTYIVERNNVNHGYCRGAEHNEQDGGLVDQIRWFLFGCCEPYLCHIINS